NAAGPRSVRCGSVRRWVEAIELIGADGEARRVTRGAGSGDRFPLSADQRRLVAGRFPKTRKNSAGYALNHFAEAGDELDLLLVEFERGTQAAARGVVGDAVRGLAASTAHVATAVDRAGLERLWAVRRLASPALARLPDTQRSLQVVEDGCVPLERLGAYVAGIRAAAQRHGIPVAVFGHAGDGHVHVNALPDVTR